MSSSSDNDNDYVDSDMEVEEAAIQFLTLPEIRSLMTEYITEVESVLEVSPGICRLLLQKFNWSKEKLFDKFYEAADTTTFLNSANVALPDPSVGTVDTPLNSVQGTCEICFDLGQLSGPSCSHKACKECWRGYLTEKIQDARECEIKCMMPKCDLLIEEEKVLIYITDPAVVENWHKLTLDSFVQSNPLLKWCPGVECGRAVKLVDTFRQPVTCPCGTQFCSCCGNEIHEPITCKMLKTWNSRCQEDQQTFNYIVAYTKDCPKCQTAIEKNGGCNHMSCRSASCHHEFCWICLKPWKGHNACQRFNEEKKVNDARASLTRYLFFYERFNGHAESLKLENNLHALVDLKMVQLQQQGARWVDVQFLKKAVETLSTCRRTLMYTYAFAYFLKTDNNSQIFESNQADLHMAVEILSGFLENEMINESHEIIQIDVQDKLRYVEQRRKVLLDHCQEGYDLGFWEFNESGV